MNTGIEIRQDMISRVPGRESVGDRLARIFAEIEPMLARAAIVVRQAMHRRVIGDSPDKRDGRPEYPDVAGASSTRLPTD